MYTSSGSLKKEKKIYQPGRESWRSSSLQMNTDKNNKDSSTISSKSWIFLKRETYILLGKGKEKLIGW